MDSSNTIGHSHAGILYPSDIEELRDAVRLSPSDERLTLPAAALIPHASYRHILPVLKTTFSYIQNCKPKRIVLIGKAQRDVFGTDFSPVFITTKSDRYSTPMGNIAIDYQSISEAIANTALCDDSYFHEDTVLEPILPFIASTFTEIPVIPVLVIPTDDVEHHVQALFNTIERSFRDVLYILSANISNYTESESALSQAKAAIASMQSESPYAHVSDEYSILRAVRTKKPWTLLSLRSSYGRTSFTDRSNILNNNIREIWYAGAVKEMT